MSEDSRTDDLLARLTADLKPVRRVAHPAMAALAWLAVAALVISIVVALFGFRHDIAYRLSFGIDMPQMVFAAMTGALAAFAAFQLALPDRDWRWALLPLPAAALWIATMGFGCLLDFARQGWEGIRLGTSFGCLRFIVGFGVPLTVAFLWLARHAAPLRPGPVAALGGLAAASIASIGLTLVHHLDAAVMVLVWHGGSVALVVLLARLAAPLFARFGASALTRRN